MMTLVEPKPKQGRAEISRTELVAEIRRSLARHGGPHRRVVDVQIRSIEGDKVHGFVSLTNASTDQKFLLDFEATISRSGALSSLRMDGTNLPISPARRRTGGRA
jgi:hypothetical protein